MRRLLSVEVPEIACDHCGRCGTPYNRIDPSMAWSGMISRERGGSIGFTEAPLLHYVNARWPRGSVSFRNIHYHIGNPPM